ncbi:MAG: hypothetical protein ABJE47_08405 [bacterium]
MPGHLSSRHTFLAVCCLIGGATRTRAQDTSFAAMQARGKVAMGVDQYASIHRFDDLSDGGRIQLQNDKKDSVATRVIRTHLRGIAKAFSSGDFSTPAFVHMTSVPGSQAMTSRREAIRYAVEDRPGGGALRMVTSDTTAIRAIHEFLAFQRSKHHAAGHDMHGGMPPMQSP